jgi:LCP family protein required for cell wall assembly
MSPPMSPARSLLRVVFRRFAIACSVLAVSMTAIVVAVNYVFDLKLSDIKRVNVHTAPAPPDGANFLLIGSDTRAFVSSAEDQQAFGSSELQGGQRSDSMMVVHVEPDQEKILVISLPRDLWVDIPGKQSSKINSAFNDGPDLVVETLKENFGIEINHYVEVDFKSFQDIVEAIGSVPTYFPYPARDKNTGLLIPAPGCRRLNGPASLAYVRSRGLQYFSEDSKEWLSADAVPDIDRIKRQQAFIRSMAGLAIQKSLNDPITLNEISNSVIKNLKVDDGFSNDEIKDLIDAFRTVNPNDPNSVDMRTFAWKTGADQGGQSVLYPDDALWPDQVALLNDFGAGEVETAASVVPADVKVKILNASGTEGFAAGVQAELKDLGFKDGGTGNDDRGTIALTEVRYSPDAQAKGNLLLKYLDPQARLVKDSSLKGADVVIVLGTDFQQVVVPSTTSGSTSTTTGGTTSATTGGSAPDASLTPAPITNQDELGEAAPKTPPCT